MNKKPIKIAITCFFIIITAMSSIFAYLVWGDAKTPIKNPITQEEAVSLALAVEGGNISEVELQMHEERLVYTIELQREGNGEVTIDANTGNILAIENKENEQNKEEPATSQVSEEEARRIALGRIDGKVTDVEIETKKGRKVYVIEIDDGGDEVDVFVDTKTGAIVATERDDKWEDD